ncbi:MBL-fold metallo-hydrolase superfamily [hydrothermal vent metagenome]|uniref:MBL-fold metallo-hydrolase superfamily n=1 Tax=hydrothermal vent metagenome TaxID=652676 RepID=A0A3B0S770_9ZZZZ
MAKKFGIAAVIIVLLLVVGIWQRHRIMVPLATTGERIMPSEEANLPADGKPFGEEAYFVVVQLDERTFAIAEPYSWTRNINYLIAGADRALLLDAGVGFYDIRPVVKQLTDLPITFIPSHLHYDHTGLGSYDRIALVDLPHLRKRAKGDEFTPNWGEHLGVAEGLKPATWKIDEWVKPGSEIDLGDRKLTLLYTPGHTDNSISLFDSANNVMFTGDYMSADRAVAYYPGSNMGDYLQSAYKILKATVKNPDIALRGAHAGEDGQLPRKSRADIEILRDQLIKIKNGDLSSTGSYPRIYAIKEDVVMQAEPSWLQDWSPTYPDEEN